MSTQTASQSGADLGGIAGWVMARLRSRKSKAPRLALVERITLGPHQSLALVEAEGRRLLVATSGEGTPAFYALDEHNHGGPRPAPPALRTAPARSAVRTAVRTAVHRPARVS